MRNVHKRVILAVSCALSGVAMVVGVLTVAVPASTAASTPPTVTTGTAARTGHTGETLTGTVNPNGEPTTYYFEYGPTTSYGSQTTTTSAGAGTASVNDWLSCRVGGDSVVGPEPAPPASMNRRRCTL
jgi:hypothetical protein